MNRVYDLRPGLKWWANSGPSNSGWSYESWGYFPIPERNLLVMITPKVACTSVVKALLKRYHPNLYEEGLRRVELVEKSRRFSVWHTICGERGLLTFEPERYPGFQPIGLIRDPVRRFVSAFRSQGDGPDATAAVPHTIGILDFLQWMAGVGPFVVDKHFAPQWRGWNKRATLFPMEQELAMKEFLGAIDVEELPWENKSSEAYSVGDVLGLHGQNFVGNLYAEDMKVWSLLTKQWGSLVVTGEADEVCKKAGLVVVEDPQASSDEVDPGKTEPLKDPRIETTTMAVGEGDMPDLEPDDSPSPKTEDVLKKIEELKKGKAGDKENPAS